MTMAAHTITTGFDTTSFSGENGHNQWFDNTILQNSKLKNKNIKNMAVTGSVFDGVVPTAFTTASAYQPPFGTTSARGFSRVVGHVKCDY